MYSRGTVIQVYGRFFAGIMDMNMEQWYKIHGNLANEPFNITGVSQFSIVGEPDSTLQKYANCERTDARVKADIRKNFGSICEKAHCDWFVIDNSPALIGLTLINNQFYSLMGGEKTDFTDDYYNNNEEVKANYIKPANEGFSERFKHQYDRFIEIVLSRYEADRIILVRSHTPRFRSDNGEIAKSNHSENARVFLHEIDDYFIKKVKCAVIETPLRFFETNGNGAEHMFAARQWDLQLAIEQDVIAEIERPSAKNYRGCNGQNISGYIADGGADLGIISDYFTQSGYSFDDVASLFWLYKKSEDKRSYTDIARRMLLNKNATPYLYTKELFERNVNKLKEYSYCLINLSETCFEEKVVVRLDAKHYLEVSQNGLRAFDTLPENNWDYTGFIKNNYNCGIAEIEDALQSLEAYFERGRSNCTNPFVLRFDCFDDFVQSLYFIDYEDILSNENYVIALNDNEVNITEYKPKVDLAFFFNERTRICKIPGGGTADQMRHFRYYHEVCSKNDLDIYYHDLSFDRYFRHVGMSSSMITACDIESRRLSKILSKKLRMRIRLLQGSIWPLEIDAKWFDLGLPEAYVVILFRNTTGYDEVYRSMKLSKINTPSLICHTDDTFISFFVNKHPQKTAVYLAMALEASTKYKALYEKHFTFPDIPPSDIRNLEAMQRCESTDAIAIHMRRTDYLTDFPDEWRFNVDYKKAMELVYMDEQFTKYTNKHLLVFSDDMEWVRTNSKKLGLGLAGEDITYVDWNHHFDSFRDMQLISMCKVIIRSIGWFALSAGLVSKTADYIIFVNDNNAWIEWQKTAKEVKENN